MAYSTQYRAVVEQVPMIETVADPLIRLGESQSKTRILMAAKRTLYRYQAVS